MKKLDGDGVYQLANMMFSDGMTLTVFNILVEAANGALEYELIAGHDEVVKGDTTQIVAALGLVSVGQGVSKLSWVMDEPHGYQATVLNGMVQAFRMVPQQKRTYEITRPPHTVVALLACEQADGRVAYALFRHPILDQDQARHLMINYFPPEEDAGTAPPTAN